MNRNVPVFISGVVLGVLLGLLFSNLGPSPNYETTAVKDEIPIQSEAPERPTGVPTSSDKPIGPIKNETSEPPETSRLPDPVYGSSRIAGTVLLKNGGPLQGVRVVGLPVRLMKSPEADLSLDLAQLEDESIRELEEYVRLRTSLMAQTVTDSEGKFVLKGLLNEQYEVRGFHKGYRITTHGGRRSIQIQSDGRIEFVAVPTLEVEILVLSPDGNPVNSAGLQIKRIKTSGGLYDISRRTWSPDSPTIQLAPGRHELYAFTEGPLPLRSEDASLELTHEDTGKKIELQLVTRPGIQGRVVFPAGLRPGRSSIYIKAMKVQPGVTPTLKEFRIHGGPSYTSFKKNYQFSFLNLKSGRYMVGTGYDNSQEAEIYFEMVEVADSVVEIDLTVPLPRGNRTAVLHVLAPNGSRLTDANPRVYYRNPAKKGETKAGTVFSRDDGSWQAIIFKKISDDVQIRELEYYVSSTEFGRRRFLVPSGNGEYTLRFDSPAWLDLSIDNHPAEQTVNLLQINLHGPNRIQVRAPYTTRDGKVRVGPLQPGSWEVVSSFASNQIPAREIERLTIDVRPGENRGSLRFPQLSDLRVFVPNSLDGVRLLLSATKEKSGFSFGTVIDSQREVLFKNLLFGDYYLLLMSEKNTVISHMPIRVPSGSNTIFQPAPEED